MTTSPNYYLFCNSSSTLLFRSFKRFHQLFLPPASQKFNFILHCQNFFRLHSPFQVTQAHYYYYHYYNYIISAHFVHHCTFCASLQLCSSRSFPTLFVRHQRQGSHTHKYGRSLDRDNNNNNIIIIIITLILHSALSRLPIQEPRSNRTIFRVEKKEVQQPTGIWQRVVGSPFQVAGPTTEKARRCQVRAHEQGTICSACAAEQR